jgi:hypothetical protein
VSPAFGVTLITFSAYARHRKISHQAVYKAKNAGRLAGAIVTEGGKEGLSSIAAADREWAANTDQSKPSNSVTGQPKRRASEAEEPYAPDDAGEQRSGPPGTPGTGAGVTYSRARAMREAFMAKESKLNYELRAGHYVDAEAVRVAVFSIQREARDMLLAVPDRVAPLVVGMEDMHEIHKIMLDEIRRICLTMSKLTLPSKPTS